MAYIIQVDFDSYWKLAKASYVFKYRDNSYRMLRGRGQGRNKERDCILSIIDEGQVDNVAREIMIYLGCLSWEHRTPMLVTLAGGRGYGGRLGIKTVRRSIITKRMLPSQMLYLTINRIPYVETKDQEDAIGLYREAMASGSPFYKFLCLWNILNIPTRKTGLVINWVNDAIKNKKHRIYPNHHIDVLSKKGVDIGKHLDDECRDAIAHIRRDLPSKTHIDINSNKDYGRIAASAYFLEDLSRLYVAEELKLIKSQFLYQRKTRDIPEYLTEEEIQGKALKEWPLSLIIAK